MRSVVRENPSIEKTFLLNKCLAFSDKWCMMMIEKKGSELYRRVNPVSPSKGLDGYPFKQPPKRRRQAFGDDFVRILLQTSAEAREAHRKGDL